MQRLSKRKCFASLLTAAAATTASGQTVVNGNGMALHSSGSASGSTWTLSSDGYLGTYIQVPSAGATVSFDLNAAGIVSNGVFPEMTLSVAGTNVPFNVNTASNGDYVANVILPGDSNASANGTYAVRVQLDNQTGTATPSLKINSLSVTGATVSNSATDSLALQAAQTYVDKFRSGPGAISLTNANGVHLGAGTPVQVKLLSNNFNFAAAVYGQSSFYQPANWLNIGAQGQNLAPVNSEQTNYQNAIKNNFNMIVPQNNGKWINDEFSQNSVNMTEVDAESQFAAQNGLRMRMHNLIWNTEQPAFISSMFNASTHNFTGNIATLNNDITSRVNYYITQSNPSALGTPRARSYTEMDVFNEPWHGQGAQVNYLGSTALGVTGVANLYKQVTNADTAAGANTRLYTNEYNVLQNSPASVSTSGADSGSDPYANWYLNGNLALKNAGAPLGGIGMELYATNQGVSASTMQKAMGNLSVMKDPNGNPMPLTLSEFGVSTFLGSPTVAGYDADLQTALTMSYGNPQVTTFGYWQSVGGPNDNNAYSLYDANYNLTATGQTWQNWMAAYNTNKNLTTDANGNINFNGTYGLYQVTVGGVNYTLNLVPGTTNYGLLTPIATATWNGSGGTNNWSTLNNWVSSSFAANAPLVFAGTTQLNSNNDSTAGTQYTGMTFNAASGPFVITGNAINIAGDVVNNSTNVQTINIDLGMQHSTNFNAASGDLAVGGKISGNFTMNKTGTHTLTLSGANSYTGGTNVTAGKLVIASSAAIPTNTAVTVTGPGSMQLSSGIGLQTLSGLTVAGGGKLDINNNDLLIHGGDTVNIPLQLKAGFNIASGYWNGAVGIISTAAANDTTHLTTLGYSQGGNPLDNVNTVSTDVLVKYTYFGDANLDGIVDGADYQQIDNGFGSQGTDSPLSGWQNGDFNYDGVIDGSDFALIDNAFNQTTASNASPLAMIAGGIQLSASSAVPEPTGFALLGLGVFASLANRRSRRHLA